METYNLVKTPIEDKCFKYSLDFLQAVPDKGWGELIVLVTLHSSESILKWSLSQFTLVVHVTVYLGSYQMR